MKRPSSSASLFHLLSDQEKTASSGDDHRVMMPFLDGLDQEEDSMEELGHRAADKKRRLKVEQVKELEKSFEVENKLEPERKAKLALELGLQPRQVAIWFQNRRARWKTKQLEKDYNLLKSSYDTLVLKHANLKKEKESLDEKLLELKSKLKDEKRGDGVRPIKEETMVEEETLAFESETKLSSKFLQKLLPHNDDSDSSAVMDDDNAGSDGCLDPMVMKLISPSASSSTTCLELSAMRVFGEDEEKGFYHHGDGLEGQDYLISVEDSCNFFSHDQVSNVPWYMSQFNM